MHSSPLQNLCLEIEQTQQASDAAELESWSQLSTKAREELATLQCTLGSMKDYQVSVNCVKGRGCNWKCIYVCVCEYIFVTGEFDGSGTLAGCCSGDVVL